MVGSFRELRVVEGPAGGAAVVGAAVVETRPLLMRAMGRVRAPPGLEGRVGALRVGEGWFCMLMVVETSNRSALDSADSRLLWRPRAMSVRLLI